MRSERSAAVKTIHASLMHDSSRKQVAGDAMYVDDLPEPAGTSQVYIAQSEHAHARIRERDLSAVAAADTVLAVLTSDDIPGIDDVSCIPDGDEPVFARQTVEY